MIFLLSAAAGVFLYAVIVLAVGPGAEERAEVRSRVNQIGQKTRRTYMLQDDDLNKPLYDRLIKPALQGLGRFLSKLVPARKSTSRINDVKLKKQLEQAGWSISVDDFVLIRLVGMAGAGAAGLFLGTSLHAPSRFLPLFFLLGVFAVYVIVRYVVAARGSARAAAIERQLPDMLDLLSVSVEAGLGFEQALHHITENMEGPLIDEVAVTYREMSMGRSRRDALVLLGERCGVADVQSFTGALIQAGQLGISIRNVLRTQAAAIRRSRRNKVQEKAAKVSTKILIPMLVFIFPVLFIVLLGPSAMTIMETFG